MSLVGYIFNHLGIVSKCFSSGLILSKFVKYNKCSVPDLSHIITSVVFCMIYVLCVRVHWFGWFTRTQICMTGLTEVLQCKGGL